MKDMCIAYTSGNGCHHAARSVVDRKCQVLIHIQNDVSYLIGETSIGNEESFILPIMLTASFIIPLGVILLSPIPVNHGLIP